MGNIPVDGALARDTKRRGVSAGAVSRRWLAAWLGAAAIGVGNGAAREITYGRRLPEEVAHQISVATAIAAFALYFRALDSHWPLDTDREALAVGGAWVGLSVTFEFTFGRLVEKLSWREMLADYNLARGRTWPLVLAWIAVGPKVTRDLRLRRTRSRRPSRPAA